MELLSQFQSIANKNNQWSAAQAQKQMAFQSKEADEMRSFNAKEAQKNRDWQQMMANSAHQREIADLKKAGLNPVLSAGGQGAATGSGSAASQGSSPTGSKGDTDMSAISGMASIAAASINSATAIQTARIQAEAAQYAADRAFWSKIYSNPTSYATYIGAKFNKDMKPTTDKIGEILGIMGKGTIHGILSAPGKIKNWFDDLLESSPQSRSDYLKWMENQMRNPKYPK